jgi:heat shock protein HtpX
MNILILLLSFAFSLGLITFIIIYSLADKIMLRWYRAHKIEDAKLNAILRTLAMKVDIPVPRLYSMELSMPNIFSVGKGQGNASIVITTSALDLLDKKELECIIAHEMYHIKNDLSNRTISAAFAGILTSMATVAFWGSLFLGFGQESDPAPKLIRSFAMSLLAPPAALLVALAVPRSVEFKADKLSAELCRKPERLARALVRMDEHRMIDVSPSHAHFFIVNPLQNDTFNSLFDFHPPTGERITCLEGTKSE